MEKKILIVEDEKDIRDLYVEVLKDEKYEVDEAADGEVGLEKALSGKFDLLLLDIMLPKKDGLQILREIKKKPELSNLIVVLLTNLSTDTIIKEGFGLGATSYIIKSEMTPDQIINEVKKVLAPKAPPPPPEDEKNSGSSNQSSI